MIKSFLFVLVLATTMMPPRLQSQRFPEVDGFSINVLLPLSELPMSTGFSSVVVVFDNQSDKDRTVDIRIWDWRGGNEATRRLTIDVGEFARVETPFPLREFGSSFQVEVKESGRTLVNHSLTQRQRNRRRIRVHRGHVMFKNFSALVLTENSAQPAGFPGGPITPPGMPTDDYEIVAQNLDPKQSPSRWQSLMGVDFIFVTGRAWQSLDADQIVAIERYVEMGGLLCLHDLPGPLVAGLRKRLPNVQPTPHANVFHLGAGFVSAWDGDFFEDPGLASWPQWFRSLDKAGVTCPSALERTTDIGAEALDHPIPGFGTVDVSKFAMLILLFAVVVGPLNFFVLTKLKRRTWALGTIPMVSILAFVSLIGFSLLTEGTDTKVIPRNVTFLDQMAQQASSFDNLALYANLSPGRLRFDADVAVSNPRARSARLYRNRQQMIPHGVDWSDGITLDEAWFPVRTPTQLSVVQSQPYRQRVDFSFGSAGGLSVDNGLNVNLKAILYRDSAGKLWLAENLNAGESRKATPSQLTPTTFVARHTSSAMMDSWPRRQLLRIEHLMPRSYLALADRGIIPNHGGDDFVVQDGVSLILGRCGQEN